jgi:hypothetical protein
MERWAANTLRTLGIILTAGCVLITSLFLLLLSMCAAQGDFGGNKHPGLVVPYLAAAVAVVVLGIWFIAWLARGILRSSAMAEPLAVGVPAGVLPPTQAISPAPSVPLHLSPLGRKSIDRLVYALGAQIVGSAAAWIFNQIHFWSTPRVFAPFPAHNWITFLLIPYVLYHLPYAILIYVLLQRPDRRAFAYSLAVPAVLIVQALLGLGYIGLFASQHPMALILLFIPWAIHIVIIVFAYQAIQQVGLHPPPSSLIVAALVTFFYFSAIHVITPLLYRFIRR